MVRSCWPDREDDSSNEEGGDAELEAAAATILSVAT